MLTCGSPQLFAAYRVLLRQSVPWHPPCALVRLILPRCAHLPKTIEKCTQPDLCFLFQTTLSDWNLQRRSHSSFLLSFPVQFSRCVFALRAQPSLARRFHACGTVVSSAFSPALRLGAYSGSPHPFGSALPFEFFTFQRSLKTIQ